MHGTTEWTSASAYVKKLPADGTELPWLSTVWSNSDSTNSAENLNALGDWEVDAATIGVFNTHATAVIDKTNVGWSDASAIYPAATATDASISASITNTGGGLADTLNDDSAAGTGWVAA